ncbi:MAG TPA: hypothetical protein VFT22_02255 [Kofleriaceae bacterium]|nr:hypothetical protein [Kofleriaceae bacterium]
MTAAVKSSQIEAGVDFKANNIRTDIPGPGEGPPPQPATSWQVRLFGRVPVTGDDDSTVVQLDRFTSKVKVGARLAREWDAEAAPVADQTWLVTHWVSLASDFGWGRFEYFPTGDETMPIRPAHSSVSTELEYRNYRAKKGAGSQLAPQLRLRYVRDWKASDKVGVVIPGTPPAPSTTKDMIVEAPTVAPELSLRFALPYTAGSELGYAPGITYTLKGEQGEFAPGGKVGRIRAEWYFYWFPAGLKGGGRVGVAPFVDFRTHGSDTLNRLEYGGIVDVRFETTLLEY